MSKANEVPREDLLLRDVGILFEEVRRLKGELEAAQNVNKLACGKCGKVMDEYEPNHYQCPGCDARARQLTIYDDEEREELAFFIKSQREAMGFSYGEMARKLNYIVTDSTLRNYEKSKGKLELMREVVNKIIELRRAKK